MRSLSTHRRHPLASVVVLVLGLLLVGGLYSAFAPRAAEADSTDEALIDQGRELFLVGCASCHGLNADGIEQQGGGQYGPSLVGVGAAAVDFQVGTGRMPAAQNSQQIPQKETIYSDDETAAMAAYIASLAPGPAIPSEQMYDTTGASRDEIVEGREVWQTNCTACHNSVGAGGALGGGKYAPPVIGVEPVHIYEAMITGPQSMPVLAISDDDRRNIIAYIQEIEEEPEYGGNALGGFGPVTEGLAAWIVGMGALVGVATWIGATAVRAKR